MNIQDIFINPAGRLRSGWRLSFFVLLFLLSVTLLFTITRPLLMIFFGDTAESVLASRAGFIAQALIILIPAILIGWLCGRVLEGLPFRAIGWSFHRGWARDWLYGSLIGAASLLLAAGISAIIGGLHFNLNRSASMLSISRTMLGSFFVFVLAAAAEEALFRGYPLQTMTRAHLAWVAIVLTSIVFAQGHLGNPNVVPYFTFSNTMLAGVWLAFAYLKTRSLWFPLGIHFSWNWTMSAVLGVPVSGITELTTAPLLQVTDLGPAWLTGGAYGLEGGAACTLALIVSMLFIWRTRLVNASEEMLAVTDRENPKHEPQATAYQPQPLPDSRQPPPSI